MHPFRTRQLLTRTHPAPPLLERPDRTFLKAAAAIGTDVVEFGRHAGGAECAFVGTDHGGRGGGGEVCVAELAVWAELERHDGWWARVSGCYGCAGVG